MRFELTPEQRALGEAARALIDDLGPDELRNGYEDADAFPGRCGTPGRSRAGSAPSSPPNTVASAGISSRA